MTRESLVVAFWFHLSHDLHLDRGDVVIRVPHRVEAHDVAAGKADGCHHVERGTTPRSMQPMAPRARTPHGLPQGEGPLVPRQAPAPLRALCERSSHRTSSFFAKSRGVAPAVFVALASAPLLSSTPANSASPSFTATCRGVSPS
mmetsp:Transcript_21765/g.67603  ORF Transcript_21765/g.67603 Transcript_21765/m.67603 type:complete len:145 (-) Transcript_21765:372-806(-)